MLGDKILDWISQNKITVIILIILTLGIFLIVLIVIIVIVVIIRINNIRKTRKIIISHFNDFISIIDDFNKAKIIDPDEAIKKLKIAEKNLRADLTYENINSHLILLTEESKKIQQKYTNNITIDDYIDVFNKTFNLEIIQVGNIK